MEHPPSPTNSEPSRRGSHVAALAQGVSSQPQNVDVRRPSRISEDVQSALQSRRHGDGRKSLEIEVNERSPLLAAQEAGANKTPSDCSPLSSPTLHGVHQLGNAAPIDTNRFQDKSSWFLFTLTVCLGGLQLAWAVELSNGSPYLLSLGLSKSLLALVWIAGPLTGVLVQPYIGALSDQCRSRFGRRRPCILGGAIATVISLMALAWAREFIGALLHAFGVPSDSQAIQTTAIVFAVIMVYVLDFSINVIQAAIRAFIVDNAPAHQQDTANAWASRLSNVGNIILYVFGYVDLPRYFWFFGNTQFKILCVIASVGLLATVATSCLSVSEASTRHLNISANNNAGLISFFRTLSKSVRYLPRQISRICQVQLLAWIGWFPFLFYCTTYIGEIYVDPIFRANPNLTPDEVDKVWEEGTRIGTFALLIYAVSSLAASIVIPWFVVKPLKKSLTSGEAQARPGPNSSTSSMRYHLDKIRQRLRLPSDMDLGIPHLTLRRTWMFSHLLFAFLMLMTFAARSTTTATILIALVGIPWSVTMWAPFALIAAEIRKQESIGRISSRPHADGSSSDPSLETEHPVKEAGLILGIHNVAISAPQVLATLISSAIFRALQKPRGVAGDGSVAWVLRFGGLCAIGAAVLTWRVGEPVVSEDSEEHA